MLILYEEALGVLLTEGHPHEAPQTHDEEDEGHQVGSIAEYLVHLGYHVLLTATAHGFKRFYSVGYGDDKVMAWSDSWLARRCLLLVLGLWRVLWA